MANMRDAAERKGEPGIQDALNTWHAAQNFYENVSDPDLIDFAIFDMEAARRRYMYMLKMARTGERKNGPR
jgi:hypothetical protein